MRLEEAEARAFCHHLDQAYAEIREDWNWVKKSLAEDGLMTSHDHPHWMSPELPLPPTPILACAPSAAQAGAQGQPAQVSMHAPSAEQSQHWSTCLRWPALPAIACKRTPLACTLKCSACSASPGPRCSCAQRSLTCNPAAACLATHHCCLKKPPHSFQLACRCLLAGRVLEQSSCLPIRIYLGRLYMHHRYK